MAIGTNDVIDKVGTQDSVDDGSTVAIANNAFSVAADITAWVNTDDAPFARFVLTIQFATMPTVGSIDLFARPLNIDGTTEPPIPSANYENIQLGSFPIDFGSAINTDIVATIPQAVLPNWITSQNYEFYLRNRGTGQSVSASWTLKITPWTRGPK